MDDIRYLDKKRGGEIVVVNWLNDFDSGMSKTQCYEKWKNLNFFELQYPKLTSGFKSVMKRLLLLALVASISTLLLRQPIQAQTPLAIGEWETLQSYRTGRYVTQSEEFIIYSTGTAIFYLDKTDLSITTLTRDDGLAETEIRLIRYHEPTATLIIVYENSVIDLFNNGRFSTLRQIDNFNFSLAAFWLELDDHFISCH